MAGNDRLDQGIGDRIIGRDVKFGGNAVGFVGLADLAGLDDERLVNLAVKQVFPVIL